MDRGLREGVRLRYMELARNVQDEVPLASAVVRARKPGRKPEK